MEKIKNRKSLRLKNYNYSQEGMYFITICTKDREPILSKIYVGAGLVSARNIELTNIGRIINNIYINLEKEFLNIKLHDYIIMPNHIHGIIEILNLGGHKALPYSICDIICSFKSKTTILIIKEIKLNNIKPFNNKIWQRGYYEHIIRNENELNNIIKYIKENPYKIINT